MRARCPRVLLLGARWARVRVSASGLCTVPDQVVRAAHALSLCLSLFFSLPLWEREVDACVAVCEQRLGGGRSTTAQTGADK